MGVWQGVAMDSLKFHLGLACQTLLSPAGGPPLKRTYGRLRGGLPAVQATYGRLLLPWSPHALRIGFHASMQMNLWPAILVPISFNPATKVFQ
jgi:hypothetical protein